MGLFPKAPSLGPKISTGYPRTITFGIPKRGPKGLGKGVQLGKIGLTKSVVGKSTRGKRA